MGSGVVDLTLSDSEEEADVEQQPRIQSLGKDPKPAQASKHPREPSADANEEARRQSIMKFAQDRAKRLKLSSEAGSPSAAAAGTAAAAAAQGGQAGTSVQVPAVAEPAGDAGAVPPANQLLAQLARERAARQQQQQKASSPGGPDAVGKEGAPKPSPPGPRLPQGSAPSSLGGLGALTSAGGAARATAPAAGGRANAPGTSIAKQEFSLLTYNVWFREDVALEERMAGIGAIITQNQPTFICLQEVTPNIAELFLFTEWWDDYTASPVPAGAPYFTLVLVKKRSGAGTASAGGSFSNKSFSNSVMGRGLLQCQPGPSFLGAPLLVATSHLESPCPPQGFYSPERQRQMAWALEWLQPQRNAILAGDMNWTDSRDGPVPLLTGWQDAWSLTHPGEPGFTYDTKANPMLVGRWPGSRLDRVLVKLADWEVSSMIMVGREVLPGVMYTHTDRAGRQKRLPVLPSDHFGLLVKLRPK